MKRKEFIEKIEELRTKYNDIRKDYSNNNMTQEEFSMQCDMLYAYFWQLDKQLSDREYKKLGMVYTDSIELFLKTLVNYGTDNIKQDFQKRKDYANSTNENKIN